jgi:hypothetical protein
MTATAVSWTTDPPTVPGVYVYCEDRQPWIRAFHLVLCMWRDHEEHQMWCKLVDVPGARWEPCIGTAIFQAMAPRQWLGPLETIHPDGPHMAGEDDR